MVWERMKCKGIGMVILRICIILVLKSRLQSTYVTLMVFSKIIVIGELVKINEGEVKVEKLR